MLCPLGTRRPWEGAISAVGKLERPCTSHLPELAWMRSLLSIAGSAGTVWQPLSQDLHPPWVSFTIVLLPSCMTPGKA